MDEPVIGDRLVVSVLVEPAAVDTEGIWCENCNRFRSLDENARIWSEHLCKDLAEPVRVDFLDTGDQHVRSTHRDVMEVAVQRELGYPLVLVNGELRNWGGLDYQVILEGLREVVRKRAS